MRENLSRIERGGDSSKSEVSRIGRRKCPEWTEREREKVRDYVSNYERLIIETGFPKI